ncbi:GNAT family N-acetyltransferase [Kitasatospora sp. NPDC006697]|uniref:GNAT family N-acetyltransferase n=1 Tax=Kitasatospora sp. NPDC006697 TaxID=3364020 RepID=UPI0036B9B1C5
MTATGDFRLRPVDEGDLPLIARWMNDPAVAEFWELAGPAELTWRHVRPQLEPGSHSRPYLGLLDGEPVSYWEVYRADRDRLASYYPARPGDVGVHLLLGPPGARGRGLGALLIDAVAEELLAEHSRVVAEPDLRNHASVRSFERAGFRRAGELELPEKRAVLMLRDRARTRTNR